MRRRKLLVALAGLAVVSAAGVLVLWPKPSRVTRENIDRIRDGMSLAEVEAILGPRGDYTTGPTQLSMSTDWGDYRPYFDVHDTSANWEWKGDTACLIMQPGPHRVEYRVVVPMYRVRQGHLDNLLWRAQRQWDRWFPE
jgi:hypothetical protein